MARGQWNRISIRDNRGQKEFTSSISNADGFSNLKRAADRLRDELLLIDPARIILGQIRLLYLR